MYSFIRKHLRVFFGTPVFLRTRIVNQTVFIVSCNRRDKITICSHKNRTRSHRQTKQYGVPV